MRRSEMSEPQLQVRDSIVQRLERAGWTSTHNHRLFDDGLWMPYVVEMEHRAPQGLLLQLRLDIAKERIHLAILRNAFQGETLYIDYAACLEALLAVVVRHQETITQANFRDFVRELVRACPETYAAEDEDSPLKRVVP
jgi:hypothetical protein